MATNNATDTSKPVSVPQGGTGDSSLTAYNVICGGTTSTAQLQVVSGTGTTNQVLTSAGAGALPVWATASGSAGNPVFLQTLTASNTQFLTSTIFSSTYNNYIFYFNNIVPVLAQAFSCQISEDGGSSWYGAASQSGCTQNPYNSSTVVVIANPGTYNTTTLGSHIDANTSYGYNGTLYMNSLNVNNICPGGYGTYSTYSTPQGGFATGYMGFSFSPGPTGVINAIRFFFGGLTGPVGSTNIAQGTISIYGILE